MSFRYCASPSLAGGWAAKGERYTGVGGQGVGGGRVGGQGVGGSGVKRAGEKLTWARYIHDQITAVGAANSSEVVGVPPTPLRWGIGLVPSW